MVQILAKHLGAYAPLDLPDDFTLALKKVHQELIPNGALVLSNAAYGTYNIDLPVTDANLRIFGTAGLYGAVPQLQFDCQLILGSAFSCQAVLYVKSVADDKITVQVVGSSTDPAYLWFSKYWSEGWVDGWDTLIDDQSAKTTAPEDCTLGHYGCTGMAADLWNSGLFTDFYDQTIAGLWTKSLQASGTFIAELVNMGSMAATQSKTITATASGGATDTYPAGYYGCGARAGFQVYGTNAFDLLTLLCKVAGCDFIVDNPDEAGVSDRMKCTYVMPVHDLSGMLHIDTWANCYHAHCSFATDFKLANIQELVATTSKLTGAHIYYDDTPATRGLHCWFDTGAAIAPSVVLPRELVTISAKQVVDDVTAEQNTVTQENPNVVLTYSKAGRAIRGKKTVDSVGLAVASTRHPYGGLGAIKGFVGGTFDTSSDPDAACIPFITYDNGGSDLMDSGLISDNIGVVAVAASDTRVGYVPKVVWYEDVTNVDSEGNEITTTAQHYENWGYSTASGQVQFKLITARVLDPAFAYLRAYNSNNQLSVSYTDSLVNVLTMLKKLSANGRIGIEGYFGSYRSIADITVKVGMNTALATVSLTLVEMAQQMPLTAQYIGALNGVVGTGQPAYTHDANDGSNTPAGAVSGTSVIGFCGGALGANDQLNLTGLFVLWAPHGADIAKSTASVPAYIAAAFADIWFSPTGTLTVSSSGYYTRGVGSFLGTPVIHKPVQAEADGSADLTKGDTPTTGSFSDAHDAVGCAYMVQMLIEAVGVSSAQDVPMLDVFGLGINGMHGYMENISGTSPLRTLTMGSLSGRYYSQTGYTPKGWQEHFLTADQTVGSDPYEMKLSFPGANDIYLRSFTVSGSGNFVGHEIVPFSAWYGYTGATDIGRFLGLSMQGTDTFGYSTEEAGTIIQAASICRRVSTAGATPQTPVTFSSSPVFNVLDTFEVGSGNTIGCVIEVVDVIKPHGNVIGKGAGIMIAELLIGFQGSNYNYFKPRTALAFHLEWMSGNVAAGEGVLNTSDYKKVLNGYGFAEHDLVYIEDIQPATVSGDKNSNLLGRDGFVIADGGVRSNVFWFLDRKFNMQNGKSAGSQLYLVEVVVSFDSTAKTWSYSESEVAIKNSDLNNPLSARLLGEVRIHNACLYLGAKYVVLAFCYGTVVELVLYNRPSGNIPSDWGTPAFRLADLGEPVDIQQHSFDNALYVDSIFIQAGVLYGVMHGFGTAYKFSAPLTNY